MTDDRDLQGLDPYDLMDREASRLDRFYASAGDNGWSVPSRCEGWSVRDVLAHLAASEDYNTACLDGSVSDFMTGMGAKGATDMDSANEVGIRELDGRSPAELLDLWRAANGANRREFRLRDGGDVDSSVGPYPARWQAFHLASELATHADDVAVPVTSNEAEDRTAWRAAFSRFALKEVKPEAETEAAKGRTHVRADGFDLDLTDEEFVEAAAARLPADRLGADATAALSTMS